MMVVMVKVLMVENTLVVAVVMVQGIGSCNGRSDGGGSGGSVSDNGSSRNGCGSRTEGDNEAILPSSLFVPSTPSPFPSRLLLLSYPHYSSQTMP